jgi:predicted small secreted protein
MLYNKGDFAMKKAIALISACVLAAALLSGCGSGGSASSGSASSPAASSSATTSCATSSPGTTSGTTSETTSGTTYQKADLDKVLDACKSFEPDSAGGSLKSAAAAAGLVEFSARNATDANLKALGNDVESWYNGLTQTDKNQLKNNWQEIYQDAQAIVADPSSTKDLLTDAGVTTDFSKMDLSTGISVCNLLDSLMKNT